MADWWTKPARRAIERHVKPQLEAAGLHIRWPGYKLPSPMPEEYVRFSFHPGRPQPVTMGRNRRTEARCYAKFGVFTRASGASQDRNDDIAGIVALAFAKNLVLEEDGIRLDLDTVDHTEFVEIPEWGYSPVDVNFMVWRTTS